LKNNPEQVEGFGIRKSIKPDVADGLYTWENMRNTPQPSKAEKLG
jgi:hypothetical protein